jgi:protein-S-isoprenylcysteine O-methyltransferase Ste14
MLLIHLLNFLLGLWALYVSIIAAKTTMVWSFQTVLILLFILVEGIQGILLIIAPPPKVALQQPLNILAVFGVIFLTIEAGVNVVRSPLPNPLGMSLLLAGMLLSLWAVLSLGRKFGVFAEVRGICSIGPYRFLRHPMYTGYALQYVGLALQTTDLKSWMCLAGAGLLQAVRAWQEERALEQHSSSENIRRL